MVEALSGRFACEGFIKRLILSPVIKKNTRGANASRKRDSGVVKF